MKIICLNTWGGRKRNLLLDFITKHKENTDIFCFQEIYYKAQGKEDTYLEDSHDLHSDLHKILTNHNDFFAPHLKDWFGISMFVDKNTEILFLVY